MPSTSTPKAAKEKLQPDSPPKQRPVTRPKQPHLPVGAKGPGPGPGSVYTCMFNVMLYTKNETLINQ